MTIATTVSQITIQGNGATTLFGYEFLIPASTDVVITVTDTTVDPVTTTTIPSSQYTITGINDPDGGEVEYPLSGSPIAAGVYITIARVLPLIQTYQISNQGAFYAQVVEAALDYQMMCIQQLSNQIAAASFPDTFLGISGTSPIVVSQSGGQYVVSLDPITASSISDGAVTTAKLADGAATLAKLDRTGTSGYVLTAQGVNNAPIWAATSTVSQAPPVRQTVLASSVDSNGFPNFITAGTGLTASISATSVNVFLTAANGFSGTGGTNRIGSITADTTITGLTDNSTNYLYADIASNGAVTLGKTTLAPAYQWGGAYSTTNGQFTFNIQEMVGKVGNGSTADQAYRVFIGEAVTSGGSITSVRNYALMGRWRGAAATITASSNFSSSHNIGVAPDITAKIRCTSADLNYSVGDVVLVNYASTNGSFQFTPIVAGNTLVLIISATIYIINKTSFAFGAIDMSKWVWTLSAERGW